MYASLLKIQSLEMRNDPKALLQLAPDRVQSPPAWAETMNGACDGLAPALEFLSNTTCHSRPIGSQHL